MPKRKRPQEQNHGAAALTPRQFASSMETLLAGLQITNGAMEALRIAHMLFLDLMASELACKEERLERILQPQDIKECLERLEFSDLITEQHSLKQQKAKKKKKKKFQVNQDMVAEQERLLEQSRLAVQAQQRQERDLKPSAK